MDVSTILQYALSRGFQINPDVLGVLERASVEDIRHVIKEIVREKLKSGGRTISSSDIICALGGSPADEPFENRCEVVVDPTGKTASGEGVVGFGSLFVSRYEKMRRVVAGRPEAKSFKRVASIKANGVGDGAYTCGLVWGFDEPTRKRGGRLFLEDPTGTLELIVPYEEGGGSVIPAQDQFVVVRVADGRSGGLIAQEIDVPDVAMRAPNKSTTDVYAVLLSDLHVGSRYFMKKEFDGFLAWLSSDEPMALRVGFVLICGDVVDGVGIYPNQNKELVLYTAEEQMARLDELVGRIPERIKVVISPGNHDPGRRALPQPAIPRRYASALWERPNVVMVGNPATVLLNGVRVLMYHGQGIDDVVKVMPNLSYQNPTNAMKVLLRSRHLSPIYGRGTPIAPELEDMMVVEDVPDIFHAGHVHVTAAEKYRGVTLINSGAWQAMTPFQESAGITPSPGYAVLVNLKTHMTTTRAFSD